VTADAHGPEARSSQENPVPTRDAADKRAKPAPRSFLEVPAGFGRRSDARWVVDEATPRRLLAASWLQHQAALVVGYELMRHRGGLQGFARELDQSPDYLRQKLTGVRWASFRDLGDWLVAIGPDVLPRILSADEIYPPPDLTIERR
jgi:hypothetical protein